MNFLFRLYERNPLLSLIGLLHLSLFVIFIMIGFTDERLLFGVSVWNKPAKFAISIGVFSWTIGWLMGNLPDKQKVEKISMGITIVMLVEMIIISIQAARGVPSHFNVSTWYDGLLFNIMGIAIFINTVFVFRIFQLFRPVRNLPSAYKLAIQMSLLIFIVSSLQGFFMAAKLCHTVGAEDGQLGLPFLGWARQFGDLRVAHFIGLHSIQVLPLFAWFFEREKPSLVWIAGLAYAALVVLSFVQALAGMPVF
jgi:hypothetical protein